MTPNRTPEQEQHLAREKSSIKGQFDLGGGSLKLLIKICEIIPESLAHSDWKSKFAHVLNYFANKMTTKQYRAYKVFFFSKKKSLMGLRVLARNR